ncbi:hypothetical protein C731_2623 [Mycolicibacterium hassiacum DSM 44199]|uniref:Uncharacterized protein n=1 Tax=Mycolicibacterium hassiacum (strain DSM 44199 / CIP 105218 / JCM 12690 / 3849) TaxID=1122247 RepID=K5BEX3_MYCHD|nr:hypothetical protein C731_2623 [Mycolicibacterium hassiacum DSM 44199]
MRGGHRDRLSSLVACPRARPLDQTLNLNQRVIVMSSCFAHSER